MKLHFYKYQGTGNDFVIMDNRDRSIALTTEQVAFLCDRRMGVGADGLMLLQQKQGYDFEMVYYNSDGRESSMCGNGGRCLVAFAAKLGLFNKRAFFLATDGPHEALIPSASYVELKMQDVDHVQHTENDCTLHTGSPHYVAFRENVAAIDVLLEGRKIRYSEKFSAEGINVNFAEKGDQGIFIRTYERGVENETLSCGTGVTAVALVSAGEALKNYEIPVSTPGGNLIVKFEKTGAESFRNIWLCGAATFVFEGNILIN